MERQNAYRANTTLKKKKKLEFLIRFQEVKVQSSRWCDMSKEKTYRSMEHNQKPKKRYTQMKSTDFQQRCIEEMIIFTRNGEAMIDFRMQKEHSDLTPFTKIKLE